VFLSIFAIFYLIIGLAAVIRNKPLVISSKWLLAVIAISVIPILVYSIITVVNLKGVSALFFSAMYSLAIIFIIASLLLIKSYGIFCAHDTDIRDAVIYSLWNR
ncbi:MAG: hypothetical protein LBO76_07060, partial [Treponema sp.]|nr:hypothetical protein [Treponema sp.]